MMLGFAILALIVSLVMGALIGFANAMSDAPTAPGMSPWPMWVGLIVSAGLFACWHFGWHPTW